MVSADVAYPSDNLPVSVTTLVHELDATAPDSTLLLLITHSNETALKLLYDRYSALVYTIALRITREPAHAEEVAQDVFHAVWRDARSFEPHQPVRPWLLGITRHRAIDATRGRNNWHDARTVSLNDEIVVANAQQTTDSQIEKLHMRAAVEALPHDQRTTIELAYYEGFTCVQIAARQSIPLGTVKTRLRLGLMKLHGLLESRDTGSQIEVPDTRQ